ncbi:cytochrome P450 3A30-like [Babylonia areolata]|uniref:cytochrome P450 3A30-like n=1 Tax=Babylonia areolata TaxID=304850 RepID=UPI003FD674C6
MDVIGWVSTTSVLAVGVLSLLAFWIWKSMAVFKTFEKIGLSGPPPKFLVGNARQLMKMGLLRSFTDWGKKYGKIYGIFFSRTPAFVVSDPDLLRDMMVKNFASFPNRARQEMMDYKPWNDNVTMIRDDHWKHVRSQLSPTFSSGKLKKVIPAITRVIQNLEVFLKEKARTGEEVELESMAGCFAMDAIAGAAFGIHLDSLANPDDPFNVNGHALFHPNRVVVTLIMQFPFLAPIFRFFGVTFIPLKPTNFFQNIVRQALEERRKDEKRYPDFLQLLVDAEKEGGAGGPVDAEIDHSAHLTTSEKWAGRGLTDDEKEANGLMFLVAGYNTTASVLAFTLFNLAGNPQVLRKAQEEVDQKLGTKAVSYGTASELTYLDMCMNESMRLAPPGFLLDREAVEDTELGGYQVKKGTRMMIPIFTIHTDPDFWPEPQKFVPERHTPEAKAARHPFSFMPFGHGPRNCVGMRLAQLEIRMAIATILQHYTPVLCDKSVYPPVVDVSEFKIIAKDDLWVKFKPRN